MFHVSSLTAPAVAALLSILVFQSLPAEAGGIYRGRWLNEFLAEHLKAIHDEDSRHQRGTPNSADDPVEATITPGIANPTLGDHPQIDPGACKSPTR